MDKYVKWSSRLIIYSKNLSIGGRKKNIGKKKERKTERETKKRAVLLFALSKWKPLMNHRNIVESWTALRETLYPSSSFHPLPPLLFFQRTIPKGWLISRCLLVLAASAYCSAFPRISSSSYAAHEMEREADVAPRQRAILPSLPQQPSPLLLLISSCGLIIKQGHSCI